MTAGACVGPHALGGAARSSGYYTLVIAVAGCGNNSRYGNNRVTNRALHAGSCAISSAGCVHSRNLNLGVTCSCNAFGIGMTAGAGVGPHTLGGAARSSGYYTLVIAVAGGQVRLVQRLAAGITYVITICISALAHRLAASIALVVIVFVRTIRRKLQYSPVILGVAVAMPHDLSSATGTFVMINCQQRHAHGCVPYRCEAEISVYKQIPRNCDLTHIAGIRQRSNRLNRISGKKSMTLTASIL